MLEPAKRLRLIILDACRDNPFVKTVRRTSETRSNRPGPRPDRAALLRHTDRLRRQGTHHRLRRRGQTQSVNDGAFEKPHGPGPRSAHRARPGSRRRHGDDAQPAGAVRLWLARRLDRVAGAGGGKVRGGARARSECGCTPRLRTRFAGRHQGGLGLVPGASRRRLLRRSRPRPTRQAQRRHRHGADAHNPRHTECSADFNHRNTGCESARA